ncbi:hypothetical protein Taro_008128 [Colocasia esculenta]|uniref:Uncharacterized protein n=1 Tax=Colocasia esculenta TaxID=4460 RepID=A0A843U2D9_COLES|nr:hypothetical protein [Colocasia esculenta]
MNVTSFWFILLISFYLVHVFISYALDFFVYWGLRGVPACLADRKRVRTMRKKNFGVRRTDGYGVRETDRMLVKMLLTKKNTINQANSIARRPKVASQPTIDLFRKTCWDLHKKSKVRQKLGD